MDYLYNHLTPDIFYFIERQCTPDWQLPYMQINFYDITYVVEGHITYIIDDVAYELEKGDMIYIKKGSQRRSIADSANPARYFAINFNLTYSAGEYHELPFPLISRIEHDAQLLTLYGKLKEIWLEKEEGHQLQARAIFMLILHRLISHMKNRDLSPLTNDKRIQIAKTYILENYHTRIEVRHLAEKVQLHPIYFSSLFKKQTGFSPMSYLQRIRIHMAETLLSTGGYTVTEVSYRCGFEDPFHFSKTFKKILGKSPSSFSGKSIYS